MAMKKAQMFPRLVDAEAEARFCAAVNARIEENLDDPLPDVDDEEVQASIDSIIWRAEARYSGDHLTNEFETAAQEAAYNGWLRAEVQASRAEGGPYIEVRPTRTMLSIHALQRVGRGSREQMSAESLPLHARFCGVRGHDGVRQIGKG